jgi:hypothetical protein
MAERRSPKAAAVLVVDAAAAGARAPRRDVVTLRTLVHR